MDKLIEPIEPGDECDSLVLGLDRNRTEPLQQQLFEALRKAVLSAELAPGTQLPATRRLARQLRVGRNTVIASYEQLAAEGYVEAGVGSGTRVAEHAAVRRTRPSRTKPKRAHDDPGISERGRMLASTRRSTIGGARGAFQPGLPALD